MTGTDFLLDSLLKLAGVDVEKAKAQILDLGRKFEDQDRLLREIHTQQKEILGLLKATTGDAHGESTVQNNSLGNGYIRVAGG